MAACSLIDNVKLIEIIREYPYLYDKGDSRYKDMNLKENRWIRIAEELQTSVTLVKKRWKQCRDRYVKEKRKKEFPSGSSLVTHPKEWNLYKIMDGFMRGSVAPRETTDNISEDCECIFTENFENESHSFTLNPTVDTIHSDENTENRYHISTNVNSKPVKYKKKLCEIDANKAVVDASEKFEKFISKMDEPCDEATHYFLSLVSGFKSLPVQKQRKIRLDIERLFYDTEEQMELELCK